MTTYQQILYQIVFSTKNRMPVLKKAPRKELFRYIWGILKNKKCHLYQINGVEDHLHILTHIHPSVAVSDLVKEIKIATSIFIKENNLFPEFISWQDGYAAFTYSIEEKERLITYIKDQEQHHMKKTFRDEYIELLKKQKIDFDEKYLP